MQGPGSPIQGGHAERIRAMKRKRGYQAAHELATVLFDEARRKRRAAGKAQRLQERDAAERDMREIRRAIRGCSRPPARPPNHAERRAYRRAHRAVKRSASGLLIVRQPAGRALRPGSRPAGRAARARRRAGATSRTASADPGEEPEPAGDHPALAGWRTTAGRPA